MLGNIFENWMVYTFIPTTVVLIVYYKCCCCIHRNQGGVPSSRERDEEEEGVELGVVAGETRHEQICKRSKLKTSKIVIATKENSIYTSDGEGAWLSV